jgi:tripartite-type tricarboxylate transporter receptor subunit TctC
MSAGIVRRTACAALLLGLSSLSGHAAVYPKRPIHVILTYTAGGVSDQVVRLLAPKMQEVLGQQLVIETKPGAAGNLGTMEVAKSAPDGYTVVVTATNNFVINQFTMKLSFNPLTALTPVAKLADVPLVLFSNPQVPAKNFVEFVSYVREHPTKVNFGSPAAGTVNHLLGERIKQVLNLNMQHIPFRESPEGTLALLRKTSSCSPSASPGG